MRYAKHLRGKITVAMDEAVLCKEDLVASQANDLGGLGNGLLVRVRARAIVLGCPTNTPTTHRVSSRIT